MKRNFLPTCLAWLCVVSTCCLADPPKDNPPPAKKETARIKFRGKIGAPTTTTVTATRSGNQSDIRLVAIAPGNEGVTCRPKPRLWWYQSEATGPRQLEFVLSRMDGTPKVLFRRPITPPMAKGFNVIDFNNRGFNKEGLSLETGGIYQWAIRLVNEKSSPQVYCRMRADIGETETMKDDIAALAESGNWYELFNAVATGALNPSPEAAEMTRLRGELLAQIGLTNIDP